MSKYEKTTHVGLSDSLHFFEEELCRYIEETLSRELPANVEERAKLHILDTLAAIISGSNLLPGKKAISFVESEQGRSECLVFGTSILTTATNAALANGMSAHANETDDSNAAGALHPGCIVLPAAFAAGEKWNRTGRDLIRSVALGYDFVVRFSIALGDYKFHNSGHCVPGFAGVFGAAAAASAMAGLKTRQIAQVMSFAAQQASGMSSWRRDPDHIEKAFAFGGMPARNGMAAVTMVASGMTGVSNIFSGKPNFLSTYSVVDGDNKTLLANLGTEYEIAKTTIKKWCVGSPIQPALDAIEFLMRDSHLTSDQVKKIRIYLPKTALTIVDKTTMPDLDIRLLVATLLIHGQLTFEMIHDHGILTSPSVRNIASRIDVLPSEELEKLRPNRQAIIEVDTLQGNHLSHRTFFVRGTIQNPMPPEEIESKAYGLFKLVLGDEDSRKLIETIRNLQNVDSLLLLRKLLIPK